VSLKILEYEVGTPLRDALLFGLFFGRRRRRGLVLTLTLGLVLTLILTF
jgi:hypothetical protein